jgi:preprotein translocase subunit SecY
MVRRGLAVFILAGIVAIFAWAIASSWNDPPTGFVLLTMGVFLAMFALCIVVLVDRGRGR